jgi:hypothetical protein
MEVQQGKTSMRNGNDDILKKPINHETSVWDRNYRHMSSIALLGSLDPA